MLQSYAYGVKFYDKRQGMTVKHAQENDKHDVSSRKLSADAKAQAGIVKYARLPCRGCIASCKNYHRCDGKLWRMSE